MVIDLHSHFLPEIDDGAKNVNESLAMLCESKKQGVELCVGTPHITVHRNQSISSFIDLRSKSVAILEEKLKGFEKDVPKLIYGAEIFLDNDISVYEDISKLCIEDTNCMLVELSPLAYNRQYTEWLYSLTMKGFLPIVAHIERYPYINEFLSELDGVNVIYQMNAKSLLKKSRRKFLVSRVEEGYSIIVASDMHNTKLRRCRLQDAMDKLKKSHPDIVQSAFCDIPKAILNSEKK